MADSEDIITNSKGGRQSKLYTAYHLIDPYALQCLAAIHHRGAIKYAAENWRNIDTEDHLNHAMHHITQAMKNLLARRLDMTSVPDDEDHLAHALCRITFALAKEIERDGIHPEHRNPKYHEAKTPPTERKPVRDDAGRFSAVPTTPGFDESPRSFAALASKAGRNGIKWTSKVVSSKGSRTRVTTLHPYRRGRRSTSNRRK